MQTSNNNKKYFVDLLELNINLFTMLKKEGATRNRDDLRNGNAVRNMIDCLKILAPQLSDEKKLEYVVKYFDFLQRGTNAIFNKRCDNQTFDRAVKGADYLYFTAIDILKDFKKGPEYYDEHSSRGTDPSEQVCPEEISTTGSGCD